MLSRISFSKTPLGFFKLTKTITVKCLSTSEILVPLKLSFAAYETPSETNKEYPFVILHGLFGSKQNWTSLSKAFHQKTSPQRKVIAIDLRNHGDSPHNKDHTYGHLAADLRQFLQDHDLQKIALMGHSMGGRCAMLFALKYPELVERLIVVDISPAATSPNLNELPKLFDILSNIKLPSNVPLSQARAVVDQQLAEYIADKSLRAFLLTNLIETDNQKYKWRINIPSLTSNFQSIARFPNVGDLKYLGDTLFIGGEKSDFIAKSDYPKILKLFPKAQLKYIEGAGHWVHSEKPNEFLKLTLDFLNRASSA
ncbi:sn-1-specific diacylglycerol lipase ABHD11 isoform X3 [Rhynchophorus ferrugineus]|uniref:sn-1-specific diacylglycerol lipase ABHD11 isoform X3 n=1 Tax=Rhynchophorus ferrugineus TaxID=354439 RepID=UPI003FCD5819